MVDNRTCNSSHDEKNPLSIGAGLNTVALIVTVPYLGIILFQGDSSVVVPDSLQIKRV